MIFLGDGYTSTEIATTYTTHVNNYINHIFGGTALTDPFTRYRNFFNIHVVDVVSNQSGADIPNPSNPAAGIFKDTALGASYYWDGVTERLLYVDNTLATTAMNNALAGTGIGADMRYVTVNETKYGGGGGYFATYAGGNAFALEVALHEVGHSFAHLADEYGGNASTYTGAEPGEINVTKDSTGAKWSEWIGYNDPILGTVGAFNGGRYYDSGIYRPTNDSKMRSLDRPFDPIGREAFIHEFYTFVDPLDSHDSNSGTRTNLQSLSVDTIDPAIILVDWTVNGQLFATAGETFNLAGNNFTFGTYTVTAKAYDPTPWVRGDRSDLEQTVSWTVVNDYRLVGSGAGETLTGTANAQDIQGLGGNDTIIGGGGGDTLSGGEGNDTFRSATSDGNDTMTGGAGFDVLDFSTVGGVVSVNQFAGTVTGSAGNDTLTDIFEQVIGTNFADVLAGGNGINVLDGNSGNDQLFGNGGQDLLRGGNDNDTFFGQTSDGNDTLEGGAGFDLITYASAGGPIQLNMFTNATTGTAGNDTFSGIEYVIGSNFADVIAGNHGVNAFEGGGGADQLFGNGGIDWMRGGLGNDTATLGSGNDTWYFVNGDGVDTINDFVAGGTDDFIDLTTAATGYASFAAMQGFAGAIVQSGADTFLNLDPGGGSTDRIVLKNVTATNLTAADFAF